MCFFARNIIFFSKIRSIWLLRSFNIKVNCVGNTNSLVTLSKTIQRIYVARYIYT